LGANLNQVFSALALQALAGYASPPPWLPQDPTPMALSGAEADAPKHPEAPHPADGQSQEGRAELTQVRRRLGVRGEGGVPLRLGGRDGNRRARGETPLALAACLA
jgi:hypothetical protein